MAPVHSLDLCSHPHIPGFLFPSLDPCPKSGSLPYRLLQTVLLSRRYAGSTQSKQSQPHLQLMADPGPCTMLYVLPAFNWLHTESCMLLGQKEEVFSSTTPHCIAVLFCDRVSLWTWNSPVPGVSLASGQQYFWIYLPSTGITVTHCHARLLPTESSTSDRIVNLPHSYCRMRQAGFILLGIRKSFCTN